MPELELTTRVLLQELTGGRVLAVLAADPALASFGEDEEEALLAARLFLTEHLSRVTPEEVARFALPAETTLHFTDVLLPRPELPRRIAIATPLRIASLILPSGPDPQKASRPPDRWVLVLPLRHTFFVPAGEDLDDAVTGEVKRIASAREMGPAAYRELFPPRGEALVAVTVTVNRGSSSPDGQIAATKKQLAQREASSRALEILESVSLPLHATFGAPRPFPLRERELGTVSRLLGGKERVSVLVIGPERVGKSGLLRACFERAHAAAARGEARHVFATSGARLVAGMSGFGQWQERVRRVMDAAELLDAVLWFDDLSDLFTDRPTSSVDLPSAMRPYLEAGRVRVVGELRDDALDHVEARNAAFLTCFGRVRLSPLGAHEAAQVLAELSEHDARAEPHRPVLTPEANAVLLELSDRFLPYETFPGKVVRLANELRAAREMALGSEAAGAKIGASDVVAWFSVRSGVPPFLLHDEGAVLVSETASKLRARIVGQDEAVQRVAEIVSVIKAGLGPAGKPLATLLFVGPTGVGKTELGRALAELLYGSEDRLVRFDMSEYADPGAGARLFLGTGSGEGLLTRKVREQPFSVVLLDEIEKAHAGVFDVLLQVAGEGRLTDGRGKTASFANSIVLMTSNLGASHAGGRRGTTGFAEQGAAVDVEHYARVVRETFRPELVNRIDKIVTFRSLLPGELEEVARICVRRASRRRGIAERGIELAVSDGALARLAEDGRSQAYGARALRRHVERALVTPIARLVSARGNLDGERIVVAPLGAPVARGEEPGLEDGGLRFGVVHVPARRSSQAAFELSSVMDLRREVQRQRRLDRVTQLADQVDYLVAQLGHAGEGGRQKDKRGAPGGQELALMQAEHHRLAALRDALDLALGEVSAVEELALTGFLGGEPLAGLLEEAEDAHRKFRAALVHALVAQDKQRDAATVMAVELDGHGALDFWLVPLLADLERRRWTAELHMGDGAVETGPGWPAGRRWGPPRTPAWAKEHLREEGRSPERVLLRVQGDHAGMWLALEAGLHRWKRVRPDVSETCLHVALVARRASLSLEEWTPPRLDPPPPLVYEQLGKQPAIRDYDAAEGKLRVSGKQTRLALAPDQYWERFEDVALEHLLLLEQDVSGKSREAQLAPLLVDDGFGDVRALIKAGLMINAIKNYRELTGLGLADAKRAVEAMAAREKRA